MFVQDVIDLSEVIKWQAKDNVLVKAPTGSGKSYFILNILARYCELVNKKMLIFSNRNLLKEQNKKKSYTNIDCFNYQKFERMTTKQLEKELGGYDIICFDECHYFFVDSTFNGDTKKVLNYALKKTDQIKIFSSATPEPLYETNIKFKFRYDIEENFDFIESVRFYTDIKKILPDVLENPAKSIVFFNDSSEALKFKNNNKNVVSFICSKSNEIYKFCDKEEEESIIEENRFKKKVLATTTVLDNGISLIDEKLKVVVLDITDPVTIIQALGRKRIQGDEKIILYMRIPKKYEPKVVQKDLDKKTPKGCYARFLSGYKNSLNKVGFERFWLSRFGKLNAIDETKDKVSDFLELNDEEEVDKDALIDLLGLDKNAKLKTINHEIQKLNPNFEIVSERVRKNGTQMRKWFVKKIKV
jgi:superfamily II DNA or RNA helicase